MAVVVSVIEHPRVTLSTEQREDPSAQLITPRLDDLYDQPYTLDIRICLNALLP